MRRLLILKSALRFFKCFFILFLTFSSAWGVDYTWIGTTTGWKTVANWSTLITYPNSSTARAFFGSGTLLFSTVTNTNGITVQQLNFTSAASLLYTVGLSSEVLTIANGGAIQNASTASFQRLAGSITAAGGLTVANNAAYNATTGLLVFQGSSGTANFNLGSSSSNLVTFQGTNNIIINNNIAGAGVTRFTGSGNILVNMTGSAKFIVNQASSTNTGTVTVRAGEMVLDTANAVGTGTSAIQLGDSGTAAVDTIILTYSSNSPTYTRAVSVNNNNSGGYSILQATDSGTTELNNTITLNKNLFVLAPVYGSTLEFQSGSTLTGTGGIYVYGPGTVKIQGTSNYTGITYVTNAGILALDSAVGPVINSGNITIDIASTLALCQNNQIAQGVNLILNGGTFDTNSLAPTVTNGSLGSLTLTASSTIDMGVSTASNSIKFSSLVGFDTTKTLTIDNYVSGAPANQDHIYFTNVSGFTPAVLAKINFTGYTNGALIINGNELVPVPEPATMVSGALTLLTTAATGYLKRRRLRSLKVRA